MVEPIGSSSKPKGEEPVAYNSVLSLSMRSCEVYSTGKTVESRDEIEFLADERAEASPSGSAGFLWHTLDNRGRSISQANRDFCGRSGLFYGFISCARFLGICGILRSIDGLVT